MSKKSFKPTPIPHRTKSGEPMAYYTLSDDGKIHTEVTRAEWYVYNKLDNYHSDMI